MKFNDDTGRLIREGMTVLFEGINDNNENVNLTLYTSKGNSEIVFKDSDNKTYDILNDLFSKHTSINFKIKGYTNMICVVCNELVDIFKVELGEDKTAHLECFYDESIPDAPSKTDANFENLNLERKLAIQQRMECIKNTTDSK